MVYNVKEYKPIFDTPTKKEQELAIARKIMDLLNKNKYDNIEEFIDKNQSYQDFLKQDKMDTVIKHFGNNLTEDEFKQIKNRIFELSKTKQNFEKETIKTTDIDDKEYISFKGEDKTIFIDNSVSDKPIEEEMKDIQTTAQDFQTSDIKQNTENMFKELESRKKESLDLQFLGDVNVQLLNNEQRNLFSAAMQYQNESNHIIRIDLTRGITVDEEDNIKKIENENGIYFVKDEEKGKENEKPVSYQKQLTITTNPNTIYSN